MAKGGSENYPNLRHIGVNNILQILNQNLETKQHKRLPDSIASQETIDNKPLRT